MRGVLYRVGRTAGSTTTAYQYAGDSVLLEKQGSSTTGTYSYGNDLLRKDGEYPLCDGLGSARAETSSSQAVTFAVNTDAFGNQIASSGSTASSYQFGATSGYRNDGDAGLLKVGCRYYDPQLGAFTSRDTELDQKPYLYCEHDPVNAVDPSGHDTVSIGFSVGFAQVVVVFDPGGTRVGVGGGITIPGPIIGWSPARRTPRRGSNYGVIDMAVFEAALPIMPTQGDESTGSLGWVGGGLSVIHYL